MPRNSSGYYQYSPEYAASQQKRTLRVRGCLACLPILLLIILLLAGVIWTGMLPISSFIHTGPISITTATSPTLFINNNARRNSSLRRNDVAPLRIHAGLSSDSILINAQNMPWAGASLITHRLSPDKEHIFIDVDYKYKGTIDITVPANTEIHLDSYENSATIEGLQGRLLVNNYEGNITVKNMTLTGPSLLKSHKGSLLLQDVQLQYGASFQTYQGDIRFQGSIAPTGHHYFYTYEGILDLNLPNNASFNVEASTYQQEIITNYNELRPNKDKLVGKVGQNPQAYLHLYTYKNTITLKRGQEA